MSHHLWMIALVIALSADSAISATQVSLLDESEWEQRADEKISRTNEPAELGKFMAQFESFKVLQVGCGKELKKRRLPVKCLLALGFARQLMGHDLDQETKIVEKACLEAVEREEDISRLSQAATALKAGRCRAAVILRFQKLQYKAE